AACCARRLAAMVTMFDAAYAASNSAERDQWCLDNLAAVGAHIGAVQRVTSGTATNMLLIGLALRDRFPKVAAVFADGMISYQLARLIVTRGALVIDTDALHTLDATLAEALLGWEPMSLDKTEQAIDAFVAAVDPLAVHRTETKARGRSVDVVVEDGSGLAAVFATVFVTDATAFDARLTALADSVCPADPRTRDQRRADAIGALGDGADRLACLCDTKDCPAATYPPTSGVVVYVVAHEDTVATPPASAPDGVTARDDSPPSDANPVDECADLDGVAPPLFAEPLRERNLTEAMTARPPDRFSKLLPAAMMGGRFVPGPITRRVALKATLRTIVHPRHRPPEPRYTPSRKLADFVRCRDLTCRFPGCREPATSCDVDHTIPWPCGPTQASNLKALCRTHHLLKTFWGGENGWRDRQEPDGTVVWTAPDGRSHATAPGSRLLFPTLCEPTAPTIVTGTPAAHTTGLTMPRRRTTRVQDRARRIAEQRDLNRIALDELERTAANDAADEPSMPPESHPDPPPF
nr:HNH endonuclease [Actinomycetota bacterium]